MAEVHFPHLNINLLLQQTCRGRFAHADFASSLLCMFYALCVIALSVMSCGCKYVPDFILQTHMAINEHTHRCAH